MSDNVTVPNYVKLLVSSVSGMGTTTVFYPLDVIKFHMQISGEGGTAKEHSHAWHFLKDVYKNEGVLGLYQGLSASILRQATYTGTRMGIYFIMLDYYTKEDGTPATIWEKFFCGVVGGTLGGFVAVPTDVAMTRMALDGKRPPDMKRNYRCATFALRTIFQDEGLSTLFRGTTPTVLRAIVVNVCQFVSYTQTKQFLISHNYTKDNTSCHVISSVSSALISTFFLLPMDIAKTRLQNMSTVDGRAQYSGLLDVWIKLVNREGFLSLWKGFTPFLAKSCPQGVVLFILFENQLKLYRAWAHPK